MCSLNLVSLVVANNELVITDQTACERTRSVGGNPRVASNQTDNFPRRSPTQGTRSFVKNPKYVVVAWQG